MGPSIIDNQEENAQDDDDDYTAQTQVVDEGEDREGTS